jgi:hypothetical protein
VIALIKVSMRSLPAKQTTVGYGSSGRMPPWAQSPVPQEKEGEKEEREAGKEGIEGGRESVIDDLTKQNIISIFSCQIF